MFRVFYRILRRDLLLAARRGGGAGLAAGFFVLAILLFPLGLGPGPELLQRLAPGVIWVAALLATLLSLGEMFQADMEDGALDRLALTPAPLSVVVLGKAAAHWLTTGAPLLLAAPLLGLVLRLPAEAYPPLLAALALGTPSLSLIGAVGAALTLAARQGGVLLSLIVTPLYIPVLIFGVGAVDAALGGQSPAAHLLLLAALLLGSLALAPWAAAAALKLALD